MAYEIYAFPRMDANQSVGLQYPLPGMYYEGNVYDYSNYYSNYSNVTPVLGVFTQVHISAKILVGITYCLVMSICGIGNLLLCYVIYRFRRMRTTTNLLIGNLALSDFLVAVICAPFNFYFYVFQNWPFGSAMCVAVGYLKITSLYVSTNSLLAIAIDRYIVITYPLKPRMTRGTTAILLAIIWLVSTTVTVPVAVHSEVYTMGILDGTVTVQCAEKWKNGYAMKAYALLMVSAEFLVPLVAMCVAYYLIAKTLWFREIPGGHNTEQQEQAAENSKRRTIRMLIIVVALFAICWAPYHGLAITRDVIIPDSLSENFVLYHTLFYVMEALAMSNSIFNTLIYIVFNANFRKCLMQMKFPRAFHHAVRHSSMKTRSSRPTSNFRMGTYQRSTGPDKSFGLSTPSRSPVTRRLVPASPSKPYPNNLVPPPSPGCIVTPNDRFDAVPHSSVFLSDAYIGNSQPAKTPEGEQSSSLQSPHGQTHHLVVEGNGTVVSVLSSDGNVGSRV